MQRLTKPGARLRVNGLPGHHQIGPAPTKGEVVPFCIDCGLAYETEAEINAAHASGPATDHRRCNALKGRVPGEQPHGALVLVAVRVKR